MRRVNIADVDPFFADDSDIASRLESHRHASTIPQEAYIWEGKTLEIREVEICLAEWSEAFGRKVGRCIVETDPSIVFGNLLKLLRENAGLTQKDLAEKVFCSPSLVSAIEKGHKPAKRDLVERADKHLDAKGTLLTTWPVTVNNGYSTAVIAGLEKDASKIHDWEQRFIPGLLQTRDYARCVTRSARPADTDEEIDRDVNSRMNRQKILTRENPPTGWFVIEESVLYRQFGGKEVMREQLEQLLALAERPNIYLQIMKFTATGHPGAEGPLRIIEYSDSPSIRYTEGWYSGRMTEVKDEVSEGMTYFDIVRACALSFDQSRKFIETVKEERYGEEQQGLA